MRNEEWYGKKYLSVACRKTVGGNSKQCSVKDGYIGNVVVFEDGSTSGRDFECEVSNKMN